ncbi:unnamed protein product [Rotaria sp. Silwood2]|nr:unnamed protein product [Rotaria sp. Silwood2]
MYNFWRRNRTKIESAVYENRLDSVKEDHKSDKKNEVELSSLNSEIKPLASDATLPKPQTRSTVQHKLNLPTIVEASFIMNYKDWKDIYDRSQRKMKSGWTDVVDERVRSCNFRCTLAFDRRKVGAENSRKKNCSFFRALAICDNNSCERVFDIFIKDEPVPRESIAFRVRVIGDENHEGPPVARQLTGKKRLQVGKAANAIDPVKVFQRKVESADEEILKARNFTGCETAEVIKHASADYRKIYQLDEDIFRECRIRQHILEEIDVTSEEIKGYVQVMAEKPFRLHLTSEPQILRYVSYCENNSYSHVYIDATGSIVKSLPHQKSALMYAAIFKDGNDPTNVIPLGHAILVDHTATSISYFLGTLRQGIVTLKAKVVRPSFFVTDFSPAIFNAILHTFNHEDIRGHLKRCWNVLLRKYDAKQIRSKSTTFEMFDSSSPRRLHQFVMIEQCPITWPTFGIKNKIFKGRRYSVTITNTCNIDSPLFAMYVMFLTEPMINNIILNSNKEPFLSLRKTLLLVESDGWDEARLHWLTTHNLLTHRQTIEHNAYGSVDGNSLRFIKNPAQLYRTNYICSRQNCPTRERISTSADLSLEDGWLCNEEVVAEPSNFIHGPPPFLFVDILHPTMNDPNSEGIVQVDDNFHDIQQNITIGLLT